MTELYKDIQDVDFLNMPGYMHTIEQLKTAEKIAQSPDSFPTFDIIPRILHGGFIFKDHSIDNLLLIDCIREIADVHYIRVTIDHSMKESELFYHYKNQDLSTCTFFERAYFVALLKKEALCYQHKKLTQNELSKAVAQFGLTIPQSHIATYLYADDIASDLQSDIIFWDTTIGRNRIEELKAFETKILSLSELLSKNSNETRVIFRKILSKNEDKILNQREKIFSQTEKILASHWHVSKKFFITKD